MQQMIYTRQRLCRACAQLLLMLLIQALAIAHAQFTLDFTPNDGNYNNNDAYVSCNMSYIANANCGNGRRSDFDLNGSHDDGSAFYQSMFTDASGNEYFHVIVGDHRVDSFALEYIIKTGYADDGNWDSGFTGGNIARSSSTGDPNNRTFNMTTPYDTDTTPSTSSGTATANPTRVVIRQIFNDSESTQEFLKDQFERKPLIRQVISNSDLTMLAEFDMRVKDYNDITPIDASNVTITVVLTSPGTFNDSGDFDSNNFGNADISAGGFTYTRGTGDNDFGGSNGTYAYINEAFNDFFDPRDNDYSAFCDPAENTDWSGNGACTNADGSGSGGNGHRSIGWGGRGWGK